MQKKQWREAALTGGIGHDFTREREQQAWRLDQQDRLAHFFLQTLQTEQTVPTAEISVRHQGKVAVQGRQVLLQALQGLQALW
mgnify:CR=1 FL=1